MAGPSLLEMEPVEPSDAEVLGTNNLFSRSLRASKEVSALLSDNHREDTRTSHLGFNSIQFKIPDLFLGFFAPVTQEGLEMGGIFSGVLLYFNKSWLFSRGND